jgi:hypothetical protein
MPEQNQPVQGAFGGIYNASLPELQQTEQQIGQQQIYQQRMGQQQTAREQAMYDRMEQQASKTIRGVDEPDFINLYQTAKNAQIAADHYRGNNMIMANNLNGAASDAFGKAMKFAQDSSQAKQQEDLMLKNYQDGTKKALYADNFTDLMSARQNLPYNQLKNYNYKGQPVDLTNPDTFAYQRANFQNSKGGMGSILTNAEGKPIKSTYSESADPNNIQNRITTYEYGANPMAYKNSIQQQLASTHEGSRYAEYERAHIDPNEVSAMDAEIAKAPPEKWRAMGASGPQSLAPANPNDAADVFSSYLAKKRFIADNPQPVSIKNETNLNNENLQKEGLREQFEKIAQGDRINMAYLHGTISRNNNLADKVQAAQLNDAILDGHIDALLKGAMKGKPIPSTDSNTGQPTVEYPLTMDQNIKKMFPLQGQGAPKDKISVEEIRINPNGDLIGYYPGAEGSTQRPYVIIPREQAKMDLGNEAKSYKGSVPASVTKTSSTTPPKVDVTHIANKYGF